MLAKGDQRLKKIEVLLSTRRHPHPSLPETRLQSVPVLETRRRFGTIIDCVGKGSNPIWQAFGPIQNARGARQSPMRTASYGSIGQLRFFELLRVLLVADVP